jgi:hypothetical protein
MLATASLLDSKYFANRRSHRNDEASFVYAQSTGLLQKEVTCTSITGLQYMVPTWMKIMHEINVPPTLIGCSITHCTKTLNPIIPT